ncbi:MAG: ferredoxin family protein [Oscillospiraceae bacterium]|nr:ferredoxin family protein [Oscillospiraceae bacterium]
MSIEINKEKCVGCRRCTEVCPGSLIKIDKNSNAEIKEPQRCWGCGSCAKECPVQAIAMFLGKDIGGLGGRLFVKKEKSLLHWIIIKPDGGKEIITVDSRESNKY